MELTLELIKAITVGAEKIVYEDGKYNFFRFNDKEAEVINHPYVFSPAGIQMRFKTDGRTLKLKVHVQESIEIRSYFAFDIFVNNNFAGSIQNLSDVKCVGNYADENYPLGSFCEAFELGEGEKCVEIILPHSVTAQIEEIEIENATYITPVKKKKTIVFYGDSITQGFDSLHPSESYASRLAEALDADLINKAIGGAVFNPKLAELPSEIKADYVVVAYGTNDWNAVNLDSFRENTKGFLYGIKKNYPETPIFVITPLWRPDRHLIKRCGEFSNIENTIKEIFGNQENVTVISGLDLMPHDVNMFGDMCLHPNSKGFEHYTKNLLKYFI